MKNIFKILIIVFILSAVFLKLHSETPDEIVIEDFTPKLSLKNDGTGSFSPFMFPKDWNYRSKKVLSTYGIMKENGNYYLKAKSLENGDQILKKFHADLNSYPILSWKWRIDKFPGEEKNIDRRMEDDGAVVYVIFSSFLSRKALKYTWSNFYKKDTFIDYSKGLKIFVLRNSNDKIREWVEEKRNILLDYKKAFGKNPSKMTAIALMTDSDQTESYAEADYDDFKVMKLIPVIPDDPSSH